MAVGFYGNKGWSNVSPPPPCTTKPFDLTLDFTAVPPNAKYVLGASASPGHFTPLVAASVPTTVLHVDCNMRIDVLVFDDGHNVIASAKAPTVTSDTGDPVNMTLPFEPVLATKSISLTIDHVVDGAKTTIFVQANPAIGGAPSTLPFFAHSLSDPHFHFSLPDDLHAFSSWYGTLASHMGSLSTVRSFGLASALPPSWSLDATQLRPVVSATADWSDPKRPALCARRWRRRGLAPGLGVCDACPWHRRSWARAFDVRLRRVRRPSERGRIYARRAAVRQRLWNTRLDDGDHGDAERWRKQRESSGQRRGAVHRKTVTATAVPLFAADSGR